MANQLKLLCFPWFAMFSSSSIWINSNSCQGFVPSNLVVQISAEKVHWHFNSKQSVEINPKILVDFFSIHSTRWLSQAIETYELKVVHLPQWLGWKSPPGVWKADWCMKPISDVSPFYFTFFTYKTNMEKGCERIALLNHLWVLWLRSLYHSWDDVCVGY